MKIGLDHPPDIQTCRDCGALIREGGSTTGVASGASCRSCFRWRERRGLVFDVRTIVQIQAAQKQGAA